jgi:5-formyltetrahydrofolate cyclo-ligase
MLARRRDRVPADREPAAERLKENFLASFLPPRDSRVSGYWPMDDEMDIRPLMKALHGSGCAISLPVVAATGTPLIFRRWRPGDALVKAGFGLSEPGPDAPEIAPQVLLVPLLAFDAAGNRLGFGGGFYDMTLSSLRAAHHDVRAIGVAFAFQQVDAVPHDATDQRLDAVVTDRDTVRFGQ